MEIKQLTPAIGARITGVNLADPLSEAQLQAIYGALIDHKVIFLPGQSLSARSQLEFAETFGEIGKPHMVYPHVDGFQEVTLLENDADRPPDTNAWHTDLTYHPDPPFASILHARVLPEIGGDTLWTSLYAAWEALSAPMKMELSNLEAIHDPGSFRNQFLGQDKSVDCLNNAMQNAGSALHPVIQVHPVTGRKFLYVNQSFTNQIYGYSTTDSDRLLQYLYNHINQPEFQVRHRWTEGDVAMWDNRVTQHYAVADYAPQYRRMHRVTVVKDRRAIQKTGIHAVV